MMYHFLPPRVGGNGTSQIHFLPPLVGFTGFSFPPIYHFYIKYNVIVRKRVRRDCVFLRLAGLPLGIPQGSPASPWKTQSLPPLFLTIYHFLL